MAESAAARPEVICAHCGAVAVSQCVRCKAAFYCRRKCQKFHWKACHKQSCVAVVKGADERWRLMRAATVGDAAMARSLIAFGVDVNCRWSEDGGTPLICAADHGHDAVVRVLLDAGAEKDLARGFDGVTPLIYAAENGHDTVVRTLLDAGADKDLALNDGYTPLYIAAENGRDAVVRAPVSYTHLTLPTTPYV